MTETEKLYRRACAYTTSDRTA